MKYMPFTCIVAYKNNHQVFLPFTSYIHRHLTDDLGLDLQVANGFNVGNHHKTFLALNLNVL